MRILFMGSGAIAEPTLERLLGLPDDEVVAVVTQPDRPRGRKLRVGACPIKEFAERHGVPVLDPEKVGADASISDIAALSPDLIVVAAYGQYIKPSILRLPPLETINLHPSLLPLYRGAAPIQMAIADGRTQTGVSIIYMSEEMDAGDIILQEKVEIQPHDTAATLQPVLGSLGAELIVRAIELIRHGEAKRTRQISEDATYVKKLVKEDGRIDWTMPANRIRDRVRGFTPWPGTFCRYGGENGKTLKVLEVAVEDGAGAPGEVLDISTPGPLVATGEMALRVLRVQPDGKKPMSGGDFANGYALKTGERLG
jgi:methionyl-tRNA formyltransferase